MTSYSSSHRYTLLFQIGESSTAELLSVRRLCEPGHYFNEFHITICHFHAGGLSFKEWMDYLNAFMLCHYSFEVTFDRVSVFSNGAVVALPDSESFQRLSLFMKSLYQNAPARVFGKIRYPHITLARNQHACIESASPHFLKETTVSCKRIIMNRFDKVRNGYTSLHCFDLK